MSTKTTIVAVALVMLMIFVPWLLPTGDRVALAQFKDAIGRVKTVTYTETWSTPNVDFKRPENSRSTIFGGSEVDIIRRISILGKHLQRTEYVQPNNGIITIINLKTGEHASIHTKQKRFVRLTKQVVWDRETGGKTETEIVARPLADLYAEIIRLPKGDVENLPARKIGGRDAVGFRRIEKRGKDTWTRTYWVDAMSRLPIRIEVSHRSTAAQISPSDWVMSDFVFDKPMSEKLFDLTPPADYEVVEEKIYGFK